MQSASGHFALQCKQAVSPDFQASYFDWNISTTVNFTNNLGAQAGWRRETTVLDFSDSRGDLKFQDSGSAAWCGTDADRNPGTRQQAPARATRQVPMPDKR